VIPVLRVTLAELPRSLVEGRTPAQRSNKTSQNLSRAWRLRGARAHRGARDLRPTGS
jgi:hypothetical protein